jgi:transcriptional regulator with GAF, ATPase, and Fis domain
MKAIVEFIRKIAGSDAPVLVLGESGTGKELVARAIHRQSTRAQKPFVAVNCGALAENLLESELFGHEKGAFTGAVKDKPGRFELADAGTIFLDEIGEISEGFQLKLLRVLQEGELERVGGTQTIKVDVRVVAATSKDLKEEARRKKFREDLYYRLNVLSVALPPLRERKGDLPLLIQHFMRREGGDIRLSKNVMEALTAYSWRGNIRELESAVRRAVLFARAERRSLVSIKDLGDDIAAAARAAIAIEEQVLDLVRERKFLRSAVSDTAGDLGGLSRGTVAEYLRGECLRIFVESGFDIGVAVRKISLSAEAAVNDRVKKRLMEYLENIAEAVDTKQPWDVTSRVLRPKAKNLPQKYHPFLDQIGQAFHGGKWTLERK